MLDGRESKIQDLLDREAIRDLPIIYCHHVRTRNIDAIMDLYAPDGVFDMPSIMAEGGVRRGPEAIRRTFTDHLEKMDPWPFTHNHVVELMGENHARGFVYTEFRLGSERMRVAFVGVYADDYVKHEGAWKFQSRKLTSIAIPEL